MENGLMRDLTAFFARPTERHWEYEMRRSHWFWRHLVVRNFPRACEIALSEANDLERTNYVFEWKPAFMTRKVATLAGVKCWDSIRPGPEPI